MGVGVASGGFVVLVAVGTALVVVPGDDVAFGADVRVPVAVGSSAAGRASACPTTSTVTIFERSGCARPS